MPNWHLIRFSDLLVEVDKKLIDRAKLLRFAGVGIVDAGSPPCSLAVSPQSHHKGVVVIMIDTHLSSLAPSDGCSLL